MTFISTLFHRKQQPEIDNRQSAKQKINYTSLGNTNNNPVEKNMNVQKPTRTNNDYY